MAVLLLQVFPVFIGIAVTLLVAVTFLNARKKVHASEESDPPLLKLPDDAPPIDSGVPRIIAFLAEWTQA